MPSNRSQTHQITALTEELRSERDRRMQLELEFLKLKPENDIHKAQDQWQKQLIEKLINEKGKGEAKIAENSSTASQDFAGFIATLNTLTEQIESNPAAITRSLQAYQQAITTDRSISKDWTNKLDKYITALDTAQSATPPPKPVRIAKIIRNSVIDLGVGYSANISAAESSAFINRNKHDSNTDSTKTNATLSTATSSLASATLSHLPTPATVVTSAASAVTAVVTPAIVTALAVAIATFLLTGAGSPAPAGNVDIQRPNEEVETGNVSREGGSVKYEDTTKE